MKGRGFFSGLSFVSVTIRETMNQPEVKKSAP